MSFIKATGQTIHDIYTGDSGATRVGIVGQCEVLYSLDNQGNMAYVSFRETATAKLFITFEVSDTLTESAWLALREDTSAPNRMVPYKTHSINPVTDVIESISTQYASFIGAFDDMVYYYAVKNTDKIDHCAQGLYGSLNLKVILLDTPTITWYASNISSVAVEVEDLIF